VPVIRRVCEPIIESSVVSSGIDRLNRDPAGRELIAQRGSDSFQSMLARAIRAEAIGGKHSTHRADEYDATRIFDSRNLRAACCASARLENTFVSNMRRTTSTGISEMGPPSPIPALLNSVSNGKPIACLTSTLVEHVQLVDDQLVAEPSFSTSFCRSVACARV